MNTFSENGNDFVGRLLHEGGFRVGPFSAFPQTQTASTGDWINGYEVLQMGSESESENERRER